MSMHKTPLTDHERKGLVAHGMDVGKPSQLSDAFRLGMKWSSTPTTYHVLMRSRLYFAMKPEDCESEVIHITTSEEDMNQFLKDHNIRLYLADGTMRIEQFKTLEEVYGNYERLGIKYHQVMISPHDIPINTWDGKE